MDLFRPAQPIRLIAIDLDGTLLTSDRQIHPDNVSAIARARNSGVSVVLASGRIRPSIAPFARELDLHSSPLICSNGAHVVDGNGSSVLESHLVNSIRNSVIDFAEREGMHLNGYTTDEMFYLHDDAWSDLYRQRARTIPSHVVPVEALRAMKLIKLMVIGEPRRIRSIAERGSELFDLNHVVLTESEPEYLEFLPANANKGHALQVLSKHLGINQENIMAIGDYLNDVEMVKWAGYGVAMGNAVPEVKAVSDAITTINDEGGVARAIASVLP